MIHDLMEGAPATTELADVCIVGAGAAGIVFVVERARQGKRVLLLEGGGPGIEEDSQEPYKSEIAGLNHNGIHVVRFRASGGSTTRWGGQILELEEWDFEERPWIAGSGWPFPKQDLAAFYSRAIKLEGLGQSTLDDDAAWREIGLIPPEFREFESFFSRWCRETDFARLHGRTLAESPLITVWLHANAVVPVIEGSRIRGIRCKTLTGITQTFHAGQVVWCMGGIESSRFFLQPEFPGLPWRRSGLLGRHFQDHIIVSVARIEPADSRRFRAAFANVFSHGYKYQPKIRLSRSQQQQHGILNVAALVFFHGDSDAVGVQLQTTAKKLLRGRIAETFPRELAHLVRNAPCLPGRAGLMPLPIVLTYHPTPKWNWTSIANSRPRVPVQSPSVKPPIGLGCSVLVSTGTYQTSRSALFAPALKSPPNHYER